MRKLLSFLGVVQVSITPALAVVSCDSLSNYNDFKKWVDNEESFVLYIGSDDSTDTTTFNDVLDTKFDDGKTGRDILSEVLNSNKEKFNDKLNSSTDISFKNKNAENIKNTLGVQKSINSIDFHEFTVSASSSAWSDSKWMKKMRDWLVDQYEAIWLSNSGRKITNNQEDNLKTNIATNSVPLFILIRNGHFIGFQTGVTLTFNEVEVRDTFNKIFSIFGNQSQDNSNAIDLDTEYTNLLNQVQTALESNPSSLSSSYNYDNVNLNNYIS